MLSNYCFIREILLTKRIVKTIYLYVVRQRCFCDRYFCCGDCCHCCFSAVFDAKRKKMARKFLAFLPDGRFKFQAYDSWYHLSKVNIIGSSKESIILLNTISFFFFLFFFWFFIGKFFAFLFLSFLFFCLFVFIVFFETLKFERNKKQLEKKKGEAQLKRGKKHGSLKVFFARRYLFFH